MSETRNKPNRLAFKSLYAYFLLVFFSKQLRCNSAAKQGYLLIVRKNKHLCTLAFML